MLNQSWWCFRTETGKLRRYNEELKNRLHRTITRLKDFEDQVWTAVFLDVLNWAILNKQLQEGESL